MPLVEVVVDYFVKWPIKVDHSYDDHSVVRSRLSPGLVQEVIDLQRWWDDNIAIGDPAEPTDIPDSVVSEWQRRQRETKNHLRVELGGGFDVR